MKIAVEFNLTDRAVTVHWPWGSADFPTSTEGAKDLAEALENFAIEASRRKLSMMPKHEDILAIRNAVEKVKVQKFTERGRPVLPSLDDLFGDDELFSCD